MKFRYILKLSINSFMQRKLRSWLTIIGIVIGVAAVVAILSIGAGMQESVSTQLSGLGADIVTVSPGFNRASGMGGPGIRFEQRSEEDVTLTDRDIQIIKSVTGVQYVNAILSGNAEMSYLAEKTSVSIKGVDPLVWKDITTSELDSGRYLSQGDANAIVIGNSIANDMFKQPLMLNTQITIDGKSFRIVGILKQSGSFGGDDRSVYMPISAARTIINTTSSNTFSSIQVKISDSGLVDNVVTSIEEKLMVSRHVAEDTKDFTVTSAASMQETISGVMSSMSLFLASIAAISLLVGAIGISNTMFMSVLERTKQIGILKALGTTNFEIMGIFLTESALIGFIGGLLGVFSGFIASGVISEMGIGLSIGRTGGSTSLVVIKPELILFAIGFSVLISIASGFFPAKKASSLQPTEALRYE